MINEILNSNFIKITASSPKSNAEYEKISVRPVIIKGACGFQAERFKENKVFHLNLTKNEFESWAREVLPCF